MNGIQMAAERGKHIAVFFDGFEPCHVNKDPGLIARILRRSGHDAFVVTITKASLNGWTVTDVPVTQVSAADILRRSFWNQ